MKLPPLLFRTDLSFQRTYKQKITGVFEATSKFVHMEIAIQALWTRLRPPQELGEDCVQQPVLTHPHSQWDGTRVKIHSAASAAWVSGLCHFRVKNKTSRSTFIPKAELSNFPFSKTSLLSWRLQYKTVQWGSLLSLYMGRCWVLLSGVAGGAAEGSLRHQPASESGHRSTQHCPLCSGTFFELDPL